MTHLGKTGFARRLRSSVVSVAVAAIVLGCTSAVGQRSSSEPAASPSGVPTSNAASTLPPPSGGLSEEEARAIAQKVAPLSAVFASDEAERFAAVFPRDAVEGLALEPSREVWVVHFTATAAPCHVVPGPGPSDPPNGEVCESPRPGTVTVVLDYFSGEVFVTAGDYPKP